MPENTNTTMSKPMPTIGVDMYTIFKMIDDGATTPGKAAYGDAVRLPGTVEIVPTDNGATDTFDADNGAYFVESYIESMGHDITNADIPPEIDAMMRGLDLVDGGVEVTDGFVAPYFATAWRVRKANGAHRLVRYYKGAYGFSSNVGGKTKPSSGPSEKQTATANYAAVKRDCDNKLYYYIDTDKLPEGVTEAVAIENWFKDPNWYPSTVEGQE